jgi:hypothetical protein
MDEILASIRRILAEDEQIAVRPAPRPRAAGDVLHLTEALNDDGTVRHIPPVRLVPQEAPVMPRLPDGRVEPTPSWPDNGAGASRLVSDAASSAVAASFARLSSMSQEGGESAFDALVRQMLRPLLQEWLDKNLPELVERLVRAEIARVVGNRPAAP